MLCLKAICLWQQNTRRLFEKPYEQYGERPNATPLVVGDRLHSRVTGCSAPGMAAGIQRWTKTFPKRLTPTLCGRPPTVCQRRFGYISVGSIHIHGGQILRSTVTEPKMEWQAQDRATFSNCHRRCKVAVPQIVTMTTVSSWSYAKTVPSSGQLLSDYLARNM